MASLLLSPHNDDETLFACFTLLRVRPLVVVCTRSAGGYGDPAVREAETGAALKLLGCPYLQLAHPDTGPDWPLLEADLARLARTYAHAYAPAPETGGQEQHNRVGELAARLWTGRVTFYLTYTPAGKSTAGVAVAEEAGWRDVKRRALACYPSQAADPRTRPHFERPLNEYYAPSATVQARS